MAANEESEARLFVEAYVGPLEGSTHEALKNGAVLLELINKLRPDIKTLTPYRGGMAFKCMENISAFLEAARKAGVPDQYSFMTIDLFEGTNMGAVYRCLLSLDRASGRNTKAAGGAKAGYVPSDFGAGGSVSSSSPSDQTTSSSSQRELGIAQTPTAVVKDAGGTALVSGRQENTQAFKCDVCTKFITSGVVNACGKAWHPNCFTCKKCGSKLSTQRFYEHQNKPYCERCILIVNPAGSGVKASTSDLAQKKGFSFGSS